MGGGQRLAKHGAAHEKRGVGQGCPTEREGPHQDSRPAVGPLVPLGTVQRSLPQPVSPSSDDSFRISRVLSQQGFSGKNYFERRSVVTDAAWE